MNYTYSEIFKNGLYAILASLDPAQSRLQVAVISRFSVVCIINALKKTQKYEITAPWSILFAGSRHATIA